MLRGKIHIKNLHYVRVLLLNIVDNIFHYVHNCPAFILLAILSPNMGHFSENCVL